MDAKPCVLVAALILLGSTYAYAASAVGQTKFVTGGAPPTASPGTPFSMDFRSISSGLPLELVDIRVTFQTGQVGASNLKLQLDSGDLLSIPFISSGVTVFWWYNPAWTNGGGNTPQAPLIQAWWNELSGDGILDGHYWIEGTTQSSTFHQMNVTLTALNAPLPEPAMLPAILFGLLVTNRRRRRVSR